MSNIVRRSQVCYELHIERSYLAITDNQGFYILSFKIALHSRLNFSLFYFFQILNIHVYSKSMADISDFQVTTQKEMR